MNRARYTELEQLPNVGPATARDLKLLGISRPQALVGKDPYALYEELCRATRQRHDPCVMDVFLSVVRFMEGAPAKPWWAYTAERKRVTALARVRKLCLAQPETSERLSHGEPTWFVKKKVFVMFANDHHGDGHVAVWLPVPEGVQAALIAETPRTYFRPPYVGVNGWVGIELARITDRRLAAHIELAWELIAPPALRNAASERRGR